MGALAPMSGVQLGAVAVRDVMRKAKIAPELVDEAILGNVVSANLGQAHATQVTRGGGLPWSLPTTSVNKVCSSGMKSVMFAALTVMQGNAECVLAGGYESMTNVPYYVPKARTGYGYGHGELLDGVARDGLIDPFDGSTMGDCAEWCVKTYGLTRQAQDAFAIESFKRAQQATEAGFFADEIVAVEVKTRKGEVKVTEDENIRKLVLDKVSKLKPSFQANGTVTAANSSPLNDGAVAMLVTSEAFAAKHNLKPLARVLGMGDAQRRSMEFTVAPADAIRKALANAGVAKENVDYWEINEAFAAVALANMQLVGIEHSRLNVFGGAVAIGHPIGASGARIVQTLTTVLNRKNGKIGCAAICNGGGGASAVVIERL
jgi:acetyl-CoA C-acetyltransferase